MTRVGEPVELAEPMSFGGSQRVRLSFLADRTQVDVSLPRDVPIAGLLPELVKLRAVARSAQIRRRTAHQRGQAERVDA